MRVLWVVRIALAAMLWPSVPGLGLDGPAASDRRLSVSYRGEPLGDVLMQLSREVGSTYIIDPHVDGELLRGRVRMAAEHLTAAEIVRWLARDVGLEAVLVEGTMLLAPPERLPVVWRERHRQAVLLVEPSKGAVDAAGTRETPGTGAGRYGARDGVVANGGSENGGHGPPYGSTAGDEPAVPGTQPSAPGTAPSSPITQPSPPDTSPAGDEDVAPLRRPTVTPPPVPASAAAFPDSRLAAALHREAAFEWIDAPLSLIARDVTAGYGVDLLVAPAVVAEAPLVTSPEGRLSLMGVLQTLADQTGASIWYCDGALRCGGASPVPGASVMTPSVAPGTTAPARPAEPLDAWVQLDCRETPAWPDAAGRIEGIIGIPCVIEGGIDGPVPFTTAGGSLRTVLEAGRLAGWWNWRLVRGDSPRLVISPAQP